MNDERTSQETVKPVSEGLAKQFGRMVEDWCLSYRGGLAKLEQIKGDPTIKQNFYRWLDELGHSFIVDPRKFFWKAIAIGGLSLEELETRLSQQGVGVSPYAEAMMHSDIFRAALCGYATPQSIDVCFASLQELGLNVGATVKEVFGRLRRLGYEPLPIIAAPWILLGHGRGGFLPRYVYMETIDADGSPSALFVLRDYAGRLRLEVYLEWYGDEWDGNDPIAFRLPKSL